MPIIFAAIANDNDIVAEYPTSEKGLSATVKEMLQNLPRKGQKQSFNQENYQYHTKCTGRNVYVCVSDNNYPLRTCYAFLSEIETRHSNGDRNLKNMLKDRMTFYNDSKNDKITRIQDQIEDVKGVMMDNIDKVIARGEHLEMIQSKAQELEDTAIDFNRGAKKVKRHMFMQNIKLIIILVVVILAIIAVLIIVLVILICKLPGISCK
eukprot:GEZU01012535.1.p1 GENE.GEZU01012535.1~~GEZU01012535.1.p1  ORF type:complete len:208 (-),score=61.26 GEZU01012535.1:28-651(-)